ncbi:MAG: DNA topoisomerase I [Candidatus Altiarchaeota archaeon]
MRTLILTEKPNVAERIARALGKAKKILDNGVAYYEVDDNIVVPAVGHLYSLVEKDSRGWHYPVFEINWVASYLINKNLDFTKKYLENIENLAKICNRFINACDYDIEGEVIAYNILKHSCKVEPLGENVARMKFSTLTDNEILNAYKNLEKPNKGMAYAGLTRHILDWYWGINLSRALTLAIRKAKGYVTLSIGRVQGPTLKILSIRDREIKKFIPKKYWELELILEKDGKIFSAFHEQKKFWDKEKALKTKEKCSTLAKVIKVVKKREKQLAPFPFDLTTLQTEAYRHHNISPAKTLQIAQELYTNAYISYPRTSSQKLPPEINYVGILEKLKKIGEYSDCCDLLLKKKNLKPNNGKKTDPAHPAIYPTGEIPTSLGEQQKKIYDLIVRRFMATFGDAAIREIEQIEFDSNTEKFIANGIITVEKGWHLLYGKYAKFDEIELPEINEGEILNVKELKMHEKKTKPPKRYTPASIIREMEKRNLGTKATRAQILEILFKRNYLRGKSIEVTPLGLRVVDTLEKYCPDVLSEELTRKFEKEMEAIELGKISSDKVIDEGKKTLERILAEFKKNEILIGKELKTALENKNTEILGKCLRCDGNLVIRTSRHGKFIGCDKYPNCKFTFPLPKGNLIVEGKCEICGYAKITLTEKAATFCSNPNCDTRKVKK